MRKTLLKPLGMAFIGLISFSSASFAQISVGPELGFTASGLYDQDADTYAGANIHGGVTAHFQLNHFLAVRPSVLFRTGKMSYDDMDEIKLSRISIPVPIMYSHVFDNSSTLFAGLGPNFMYNMSGKYSSDGWSEDIEFGSGDEQLKRMDIGVQVKAGYQFANGIALSSFINIGTTNLYNTSEQKLRSLDAIGFSVGWMFGSHSSE
ncbi:porin family protein [Flavihumibacter sp. UBA7668]|uniref:porin family protein n=1 Tax=Flavihumibacter sp. UBA7668 TaxID=1946542 RepID=UPI0025C02EDC|nr:porin family protein [Flavihumibacter sp. UBA7668]